jgi:hypothetical protein
MNIKDLQFKLKTGIGTRNLGEVTEHVIHYRNFYISILEGEDDEHTSIAWSHEPPDGFPVRDIVSALPGVGQGGAQGDSDGQSETAS